MILRGAFYIKEYLLFLWFIKLILTVLHYETLKTKLFLKVLLSYL